MINLNGDASWTYLPAIDRTGDIRFEFIVSDGNGGSANGTTTLTLIQQEIQKSSMRTITV